MQMRETARASILSLPQNRGSQGMDYSRDPSEESQSPILQSTGPKASGLRNYLADDGSGFDDTLMMHGRKDGPRRF